MLFSISFPRFIVVFAVGAVIDDTIKVDRMLVLEIAAKVRNKVVKIFIINPEESLEIIIFAILNITIIGSIIVQHISINLKYILLRKVQSFL